MCICLFLRTRNSSKTEQVEIPNLRSSEPATKLINSTFRCYFYAFLTLLIPLCCHLQTMLNYLLHQFFPSCISAPPTSWSRCGCRPSHCGSPWRWAAWRHSRFSALPERHDEPFPPPSARGSGRSCGKHTQVSNTNMHTHTHRMYSGAAERDHRPREAPSNLISAVLSSAPSGRCAASDALRLANKTPHHGFLLFLSD